jgi:twitching motility protein PilT
MDPAKLQTPAAPAQAAGQVQPAGQIPAPASTPVPVSSSAPATASPASGAPPAVPTPQLIAAMLKASDKTSDLIFSPGRAPQVEISGQLVQLKIAGVGMLLPEDTARIAADLIGRNDHAVNKLRTEGSCDISYSLPKISRFRVNIFTQRGSCAIVMRVIATNIPDMKLLNLPESLGEAANLAPGIVLVTGPTGSGKSSTLAALVNKINEEKACHIITIEDPIEFLHHHKRSTVHQRELHSDAPSFALALRAALRQAPKLILVGEMRDRETIEVALEAAETGHLVYSTLHTIDASKTVERIVGTFALSDQNAVRMRLSKSFRYIVSQRLIPRMDGKGRVAAFEVLKATLRTREYVQKGEGEGKTLLDAMRDGETEGMQCFDDEIEKLIRSGVVDINIGLSYATNPGNMRLLLADLLEEPSNLGSLLSSSKRPKPGAAKSEPAIAADPELEITH